MAEHGSIRIPDEEYKERAQRAAKILQREGLDALIVNSNEADYANARYFSGYWSLFERSGVVIAPTGEAALMVGPESKEFGADRSKIEKIFVLKAYREGADPAYPELQADTYQDVFRSLGITGKKLRIGVASYLDTSVVIMEAIKAAGYLCTTPMIVCNTDDYQSITPKAEGRNIPQRAAALE